MMGEWVRLRASDGGMARAALSLGHDAWARVHGPMWAVFVRGASIASGSVAAGVLQHRAHEAAKAAAEAWVRAFAREVQDEGAAL